MDKRFLIIIAICLVEISLRLIYPHLSMHPVSYTLMARIIETAIILGLGLNLCGIKTPHIIREIFIGSGVAVAFGALVMALEVICSLVTDISLLSKLIGRIQVDNTVIFFLASCLVAPFAEELFFRGLFYEWIRPRFSAIAAISMSALFFASMHGQIAPVQLVGGLLFAGLYEWRRNIWAAFTLHAAANFGIWIIPLVYPL